MVDRLASVACKVRELLVGHGVDVLLREVPFAEEGGVGGGADDVAGEAEAVDEEGDVVGVVKIICFDEGWVEGRGGGEGDGAAGLRAEHDGADRDVALVEGLVADSEVRKR